MGIIAMGFIWNICKNICSPIGYEQIQKRCFYWE